MVDSVQKCIAPGHRVLLVFGRNLKDYISLINSRKLHHEITIQGSRWYIARTDRNIIYLNNQKVERDTLYNQYPLFKEKHKILEDQIPLVDEWMYLPSQSLLNSKRGERERN